MRSENRQSNPKNWLAQSEVIGRRSILRHGYSKNSPLMCGGSPTLPILRTVWRSPPKSSNSPPLQFPHHDLSRLGCQQVGQLASGCVRPMPVGRLTAPFVARQPLPALDPFPQQGAALVPATRGKAAGGVSVQSSMRHTVRLAKRLRVASLAAAAALVGCAVPPSPPPTSDLSSPIYETAQQIASMPSCKARVVHRDPCSLYLLTTNGKGFHLGSPGSNPEVSRFLDTLKDGQRYRFPNVFREYQKSRSRVSPDSPSQPSPPSVTTPAVSAP